jgi:hypothetical protein
MIFMLLCPIHLVRLPFLGPVLTLLFEVKQIEFDFSITYSGIRICQIHKSRTILIHCLDEIFYQIFIKKIAKIALKILSHKNCEY